MVPFDRYSAVLDACVMFPMIVRDVLLTLASHEFYSPKWSPRIRDEWTRNLLSRLEQRTPGQAFAEHVERIACATDRAFPDACVAVDLAEDARLVPVDAKDRHVVMTAVAAQCDAILTFNLRDFAAKHLQDHFQIEVLHPDDFVMDLIDLNEKRVVAAFRELLARKKNPPWEIADLQARLHASGLVQTALWLQTEDVCALLQR